MDDRLIVDQLINRSTFIRCCYCNQRLLIKLLSSIADAVAADQSTAVAGDVKRIDPKCCCMLLIIVVVRSIVLSSSFDRFLFCSIADADARIAAVVVATLLLLIDPLLLLLLIRNCCCCYQSDGTETMKIAGDRSDQ